MSECERELSNVTMSDDEFEDAIEGPISTPTITPTVVLSEDHSDSDSSEGVSEGVEFDEEAELKKFDDEYDRQEVLRQARESEELARNMEDNMGIGGDKGSVEVDDGHERSIEEATKAKAEGNE